ncbi:MAG TPA: hypothetical protein PKX86_10565 [Bacteroidia bacterium]|nr:hypothetical protein [Bacteroidia bacterium]
MRNSFYILIFALVVLTSCHNDKSSDNPPCPAMEMHISGDTTVVAGDSIGLMATLFTGATYSWTAQSNKWLLNRWKN